MKQDNNKQIEPNAVNEFSAFCRSFFSLFDVFKGLKKEYHPGSGNVKEIDLK
jgi:hypothetical protein